MLRGYGATCETGVEDRSGAAEQKHSPVHRNGRGVVDRRSAQRWHRRRLRTTAAFGGRSRRRAQVMDGTEALDYISVRRYSAGASWSRGRRSRRVQSSHRSVGLARSLCCSRLWHWTRTGAAASSHGGTGLPACPDGAAVLERATQRPTLEFWSSGTARLGRGLLVRRRRMLIGVRCLTHSCRAAASPRVLPEVEDCGRPSPNMAARRRRHSPASRHSRCGAVQGTRGVTRRAPAAAWRPAP